MTAQPETNSETGMGVTREELFRNLDPLTVEVLNTPVEKRLNMRRIASLANIGRDGVQAARKRGDLKMVKVGRDWCTTPQHVREYLGSLPKTYTPQGT